MAIVVADVFDVPAGTTERTKMRPPSGVQWLINALVAERIGGGGPSKLRVLLSKHLGGTSFLDVLITEANVSFLVSTPMELTNTVFISIQNTTTALWRVGFTGVVVA